jgi:hypothetical protein
MVLLCIPIKNKIKFIKRKIAVIPYNSRKILTTLEKLMTKDIAYIILPYLFIFGDINTCNDKIKLNINNIVFHIDNYNNPKLSQIYVETEDFVKYSRINQNFDMILNSDFNELLINCFLNFHKQQNLRQNVYEYYGCKYKLLVNNHSTNLIIMEEYDSFSKNKYIIIITKPYDFLEAVNLFKTIMSNFLN